MRQLYCDESIEIPYALASHKKIKRKTSGRRTIYNS